MLFRRLSKLVLPALFALQGAAVADPITFWDETQRGANSFNHAPPDAAYFAALADTGATWVRLVFSKWDSRSRDFLIGNADAYDGLVAADLEVLRAVLDRAHAADIAVVLTPLTLPGNRWIQQNDGNFDDRLWSDPAYAPQVARFWQDLAGELGKHPALVAYNLLNEPVPERATGLAENSPLSDYQRWQIEHQGSPRDLPALYRQIIAAIREVNAEMPIMLDAGYYANPRALATWPEPMEDDRVLYSIHMYEPYAATSPQNVKRETPLRYPGTQINYAGEEQVWGRQEVAAHLQIGFDWAAANNVPPSRVVLSEFGCMRRWQDCGTYLRDVIDAAEAANVHWAYYAFREDEWDGMDYELPATLPPGRFYWLSETGKADQLPRDGELMNVLKSYMQ
ncbi:MAG: cellulase family glycosylhydrolase [Pseudomonadota bacterium]